MAASGPNHVTRVVDRMPVFDGSAVSKFYFPTSPPHVTIPAQSIYPLFAIVRPPASPSPKAAPLVRFRE